MYRSASDLSLGSGVHDDDGGDGGDDDDGNDDDDGDDDNDSGNNDDTDNDDGDDDDGDDGFRRSQEVIDLRLWCKVSGSRATPVVIV